MLSAVAYSWNAADDENYSYLLVAQRSGVNYSFHLIEVRRTDEFKAWVDGLKDIKAKTAVAKRIARIEAGLLGDVKGFRGIGEIRIDFGPGYRLYFKQSGKAIVILLCGGAKSTQRKDIARAIELAKEYE